MKKPKATSPPQKESVVKGDIVTGDFTSEFILTFEFASESQQSPLVGGGPGFYKNQIGLIIDIIDTPESFYSLCFCKLLFGNDKVGWIPSRWLKRIS